MTKKKLKNQISSQNGKRIRKEVSMNQKTLVRLTQKEPMIGMKKSS